MAERFYITTAIDYVNQKPHLGTAYEKIGADCMARYKRLCGYETWFLMGNDEHSTNVERAARERGLEPLAYCRLMSEVFTGVWKRLEISYDDFIHTSEKRHVAAVTALFGRIHANGYIYKGRYEGLYCESCEEFVVEKDLREGMCPRHGRQPERISEENWFFALSKFEAPLLELIESRPGFIRPESRRNEIVSLIRGGLQDVSISRHGATWGIPLPIDERHVIYVWFDALTNYISALGFGGPDTSRFERFWPADVHVVGKDITRFHCVIWPAMLMAAGVEPARGVFAHGFISLGGEKMSKTRGNIIDPLLLAEVFGSDGLRYLLLREVPFDRDGDITPEVLVARYNADLANELGNLYSRTLSMIARYLGGAVSEGPCDTACETFRLLAAGVPRYLRHMERMEFSRALAAFWPVVQSANRHIEERKPWLLAREEGRRGELEDVFRVLLAVLRTAGVVLLPFMPGKMGTMLADLGVTRPSFEDLPPVICQAAGLAAPAPLFPRIQEDPAEIFRD